MFIYFDVLGIKIFLCVFGHHHDVGVDAQRRMPPPVPILPHVLNLCDVMGVGEGDGSFTLMGDSAFTLLSELGITQTQYCIRIIDIDLFVLPGL